MEKSRWDRVQNIGVEDQDAILQIYAKNQLPIEVRQNLDLWIERHLSSTTTTTTLEDSRLELDVEISGHFFEGLITQLKVEAAKITTEAKRRDLIPAKLLKAAREFESLPPQQLYKKFHSCLREEYKIVERAEEDHQAREAFQNFLDPTSSDCQDEESRWTILTHGIDEVVTLSENLVLKIDSIRPPSCGEAPNNNNYIQNDINQFFDDAGDDHPGFYGYFLQVDQAQSPGTHAALNLVTMATKLTTHFDTVMTSLVTNFMFKLKWSEISLNSPNNLPFLCGENLKGIFSKLFSIVRQFRQKVCPVLLEIFMNRYRLDSSGDFFRCQQQVHELQGQMNVHYDTLLKNMVIVKVQPPRVIAQDKSFDTTLQFLYSDDQIFGTNNNGGNIMTHIFVINERQAARLYGSHYNDNLNTINEIRLDGDTIQLQTERVNNSKKRKKPQKASVDPSTLEFSKLEILTVTRKSGSDLAKNRKEASTVKNKVAKDKMCLLYIAAFQIDGLPHETWCCSLPFTFIIHTSQKCEASGAIFWDDVARQPHRLPFSVSEHVCWPKFARHLNEYLKSVIPGSGWNLTWANLLCIRDKLMMDGHNNGQVISRQAFFDHLRLEGKRGQLLFWDWFFEIGRMVGKHLKKYWDSGLIIGFIHRSVAEEMVKNWSHPGTFILRFSDSTSGGIVLTCAIQNGESRRAIQNVKPFTNADLETRSLADRIRDFDEVQHVLFYSSDGILQSMEKGRAFPVSEEGKNLVQNPISRGYLEHGIQMVVQSGSTLRTELILQPSTAADGDVDLPFLMSMDFDQMLHHDDSC